jgi:hypothetical protein
LQLYDQRIVQLSGEALDPSADRGFMHIEGACNLQECLVVQKVCSKQKAILGSEFVDGLLKPILQYIEFLWG